MGDDSYNSSYHIMSEGELAANISGGRRQQVKKLLSTTAPVSQEKGYKLLTG